MSGRQDWVSTIGNFIINFGMLDYLIFDFFEKQLPPGEFSKIRKLHFKDRLNRIRREINQSDCPAETKPSFENLINRLEPIRELRNHIADGHMLTRLDPDTKDFIMTISLPKDLDAPDSPDTRHLEYSELFNALTELNVLIEDFRKLTGEPCVIVSIDTTNKSAAK
jgi:hypothetical protein